jgi:hypothetical protein
VFSHAEKWLGELYHPAILDLDLDSEGEIYRKNATNFPVKARFSHVNVPFNFHFSTAAQRLGERHRKRRWRRKWLRKADGAELTSKDHGNLMDFDIFHGQKACFSVLSEPPHGDFTT